MASTNVVVLPVPGGPWTIATSLACITLFTASSCVLFKGFGSKKTLDKRLARMQEQLREKLPTPVSCSVGITLIRKDSYNYEDSIRQADKALYTAKHKGKDTYCYWEESEK